MNRSRNVFQVLNIPKQALKLHGSSALTVSKYSCQSYPELLPGSCRAKKRQAPTSSAAGRRQVASPAQRAHCCCPHCHCSGHRSSHLSPALSSFRRTKESSLSLLAKQLHGAYTALQQVQEFSYYVARNITSKVIGDFQTCLLQL